MWFNTAGDLRVFRADNSAAIQVGQNSSTITSWINSNGSIVVKPLDSVATNRRALTIKNSGDTETMWFNTAGDLRIFKTAHGDAIQIGSDSGNINTKITSNGRLFLNNPTNTNARAISISQNGAETAWINSDGTSSFAGIPRGAVMFFNLASCPTGWTNVTAYGWGGRFFRVADGSNPRNIAQADMIKQHNHTFNLQNYTIVWSGRGGGCNTSSCDHLTSWSGKNQMLNMVDASTNLGTETRPMNIPLTTCVKN